MNRKALTNKILVLGIDGMDPASTSRFVREGKMPNVKKLIERGAAREDLVMLGSMPTITPPMWTTLATGANANTHGITCFWNQDPNNLAGMSYALDSRKCKAEQLWNVFAEEGKKTLVWHWPGSSWPPTSDNANLHVVDGAQPNAINMGAANVDWEKMIVGSEEFEKVLYKPRAANNSGAGCVLTDLDVGVEEEEENILLAGIGASEGKCVENIILRHEDGELSAEEFSFDMVNSPIKEAKGWANVPEGAKEFTVITSSGFVRRPALLVKNENGIYDEVWVYKNKKEEQPLGKFRQGELVYLIDDVVVGEQHIAANRYAKVYEIAEDGSKVRIWLSNALDISNDSMFHPKSLYKEVVENVGHVPMLGVTGGHDPLYAQTLVDTSELYCQWQGKALNYLIENSGYDVIFTHLHNVDNCGHLFWSLGKFRERKQNDEETYQDFIEQVYVQTDDYVGEFLHLIDKGWTILITSDHGLLVAEEEYLPLIGDAFGCNVRVLEELGYTVLKKDEEGNALKEIDWEKTRAVAPRGNHIYINLKGRNATGIVEPEDQYALEQQLISDLYKYVDSKTGKRAIGLAMRNKEAALIGMSGPDCGDIIYFLDEGSNRLHGDSMSTYSGYKESSVSPIFIAAGPGIKENFKTERVIRQVDFAPTLAVLGGVRMPAQCEGAPIYQVLTEEY